MNQGLTDWHCSVCGKKDDIALVQGTTICIPCLDAIKKETQQHGTGLAEQVAVAVKENDIYD